MSVDLIEFNVTIEDGVSIEKRIIKAQSFVQLKLMLSNLPRSKKWRV